MRPIRDPRCRSRSTRAASAPLLVAMVAGGAAAEPVVVRFDPSESVRLTDHDPSAPDVLLTRGDEYLGGGSGLYAWWPYVYGSDWSPPDVGLLVESNIGPRLTSGPAGGYLFGNHYDELVAGDAVSAATPGGWGVAHPEVRVGAPPSNFPLEVFAETFTMQSMDSFCFPCHTVFADSPQITTITPGLKYIGFRWSQGGDLRYGWAAFRVDLAGYPQACRLTDPDCPPSVYDAATVFEFRFVAAAYESEVGTPIVAGGGLCRTDLNFDARIDFFDFAEFLSLYAAASLDADFSGDGLLNFFDFSEFIGEYADGCAF